MSRFEQSIEFNELPEEVMWGARQATQAVGWGMVDVSPSTLHAKKPLPPLGGASTEIRVNVTRQGDKTVVRISGSLFGFGPYVDKLLRADLGSFVNALTMAVVEHRENNREGDPSPSAAPAAEVVERIIELGSLMEQGLITRSEFEELKKALLGD